MESRNDNLHIKIFAGISGWFSAIFLTSFFFSIFAKKDFIVMVFGVVLVLFTSTIFKKSLFKIKESIFIENLILALTFSGDVMIISSGGSLFNNDAYFLFIAVILGVLALYIQNYIHRIVASFFAVIFIFAFGKIKIFRVDMFSTIKNYIFDLSFTALFTIFTLFLWFYIDRFKDVKKIEAIAYGVTSGLISIIVSIPVNINLKMEATESYLWFYSINYLMLGVFGAVLLFIAFKISEENGFLDSSKRDIYTLLLGVVSLIFATHFIDHIIVGVIFIILGFYRGKNILMGMGLILSIFILLRYYYFLGDTLLIKSGILLLNSSIFALGYFLVKRGEEKSNV